MAIDFGALPPEINSARLYSGAGSTSLVTAASAWNSLAAELNAAALGYENVVTQLASEEWLGPASASMAAAVQPYVDWVSTTAAQAEQAATQASAAAAAYETAIRLDSASAADRGQPCRAGAGGVDQRVGSKHRGDRAIGGPVRRILGPGRRDDVQLCR